jgi:hypothetical protein
VCELPCTVPVDPEGKYRVDGASISASSSFQLDVPTSLTVTTGDAWKRTAGIVGLGLGGAALVTSVAMFLRASDLNGEADRIESGPPPGAASASGGANQFDTTDAPSRRAEAKTDNTVGYVMVTTGVVLLAASIVVLVTTEGTQVVKSEPQTGYRPASDGFAFSF